MASGYRIERLEGHEKKELGVWNHYSAYKDGELIAKGISVWDCAELSGYSTRRIRDCAQKGITTATGWRFTRK